MGTGDPESLGADLGLPLLLKTETQDLGKPLGPLNLFFFSMKNE